LYFALPWQKLSVSLCVFRAPLQLHNPQRIQFLRLISNTRERYRHFRRRGSDSDLVNRCWQRLINGRSTPLSCKKRSNAAGGLTRKSRVSPPLIIMIIRDSFAYPYLFYVFFNGFTLHLWVTQWIVFFSYFQITINELARGFHFTLLSFKKNEVGSEKLNLLL
jgi:hypothetical protein